MSRIFDEREPSIEALKAAPVYFRYTEPKVRRVLVDALTASAVLAVYNAVTKNESRAKFERMLKSPANLNKLVAFAFKHTRLA